MRRNIAKDQQQDWPLKYDYDFVLIQLAPCTQWTEIFYAITNTIKSSHPAIGIYRNFDGGVQITTQ